MLKLARRARGHFVTLIEIRVHIIRVKPGHIPSFFKFNTFKVAYYSFPKKNLKSVKLKKQDVSSEVLVTAIEVKCNFT